MLLGLFGISFESVFYKLCLSIDGIVYQFVDFLYQIFLLLAKFNPFDAIIYNELVSRIYAVLSVAMIFAFTYLMLQGIFDPDKLEKSQGAPTKLIINLIISLGLLIIMPTVFKFTGKIQQVVLDSNLIGKVIIGETSSKNQTIASGGKTMAGEVFSAFFYADSGYCTKLAAKENDLNYTDPDKCSEKIFMMNPDDGTKDTAYVTDTNNNPRKIETLRQAKEYVAETGDFSIYKRFAANTYTIDNKAANTFPLHSDKEAPPSVHYTIIWCLLCGVILCYILVSFCFDLGKRVVKLFFLQLISPIPVISRAIPKAKDIFDNWLKMIIAVYLEVFLRLIVMYFAVFMISRITQSSALFEITSKNPVVGFIAQAFIILGIVLFAKEAPGLLSKLFPGLSSDAMKLGIKDKLAASGLFGAGAVAGATLTGLTRNAVSSGQRIQQAKGWKNKFKAAVRTPFSTLAGGISGGVNAARGGGIGAKSFADMKKGVTSGAQKSLENRLNRERYKDAHGGTTRGAIKGHLTDAKDNVVDWATAGATAYDIDIERGKAVKTAQDAVNASAEKIRDKNRSNSNLLSGTHDFKGANKADQIRLYNDLQSSVYGGNMSLKDLDEYIKNHEKSTVSEEDYTDPTMTYEQYIAKRTREAGALQDMRATLEKDANNLIINAAASNSGIDSNIKKDNLLDVGTSIKQYRKTIESYGPMVTDKYDNKTYNINNYKEDETSKLMKEFGDAYEHNAQLAKRKAVLKNNKKDS